MEHDVGTARPGRRRPTRLALATVTAALALTAPLTVAGSARAAVSATAFADYSFPSTAATMADVRRITRADVAAQRGYTGKGVGIALIDTGVAPVPGLTSGNVANGPDLSLESQAPNLQWRDTYGHGTHMAGIIAGRDAGGTGFKGMAPDARLISLKVGTSNGSVDVTQVIAAIDWVVEHRNDDPNNRIRVLNLSYGTTGVLSTAYNPLSHAVQNAHRAGIAVVVAAGNSGGAVTNPAYDPFVLTVGATDMRGTTRYTDDVGAAFSSVGSTRVPDFMVPGKSIVSLRVPGSYADQAYPAARVGERYFVGSGTSQSAAVVAGAAAVMLQRHPTINPDTLKCSLLNSGPQLAGTTSLNRLIDLDRGTAAAPSACVVSAPRSQGTGSIQATRGTSIISMNGVQLTGERDIFGPLSAANWATQSTAGTSWNGGSWMGRPWIGTGWGTTVYGQTNWTGRAWSGTDWSGRAWSNIGWSGATWTGRAWSNTTVNGVAWSGRAWSGVSWQSAGNGAWLL
jgi:serine protease AprX